MIRQPPRSTLFPTRRSSDLKKQKQMVATVDLMRRKESNPFMRKRWMNALRYSSEMNHKDRKSTRLNSSHSSISYAVFCLKKKRHDNSRSATDSYGTRNIPEQ